MSYKVLIYKPKIVSISDQFIWHKEWVSPFESLWGIFEKFKYVNSASSADIFDLFGIDYLKSLKSKVIAKKYRECVYLNGLDNARVKEGFSDPILESNKENVERLIRQLPNGISHYSYIRDEIYFCPECIKTGFHSIFHQFRLLKICPYHLIPLENRCPNCKSSMPFEISDKYTEGPFQCLCGHSFLEESIGKSQVPNWKPVSLKQVKSPDLTQWLNLNQEQDQKLKNCHIPLFVDIDGYPDYLKNILSVLNNSETEGEESGHNVVKSASYIRHLASDEKLKNRKLNSHMREAEFYNDIYFSSLKTVNSIISYIKRSVLYNHKTCIQNLEINGGDGSECPYAEAYDHWIKFMYGYEEDFYVKWPKPYRKNPARLEFASKQDNYYLKRAFDELSMFNDYIDLRNENRATTKWIFNRLLSHLVLYNFRGWLHIFRNMVNRTSQYTNIPKLINNYKLPFYILVVPENNNQPLEFHWWNENQEDYITKLKCSLQG